MNFATLTPTVDLFEALQFIALLVALVAVVADLRDAWGNAQWAIDDGDAFMRRLGPWQFVAAVLQLVVVAVLFLMVVGLMQIPSVLQRDETPTLDVMVAVTQRVGGTLVAVCITLMVLGNRWVRRYATYHRHDADQGARLEAALAENTALTREASVRATDAYHEANTVNEKLARVGEDQRAQADRTEAVTLDTNERIRQVVRDVVDPQERPAPVAGDAPPLTVGERIEETHRIARDRLAGEGALVADDTGGGALRP